MLLIGIQQVANATFIYLIKWFIGKFQKIESYDLNLKNTLKVGSLYNFSVRGQYLTNLAFVFC